MYWHIEFYLSYITNIVLHRVCTLFALHLGVEVCLKTCSISLGSRSVNFFVPCFRNNLFQYFSITANQPVNFNNVWYNREINGFKSINLKDIIKSWNKKYQPGSSSIFVIHSANHTLLFFPHFFTFHGNNRNKKLFVKTKIFLLQLSILSKLE